MAIGIAYGECLQRITTSPVKLSLLYFQFATIIRSSLIPFYAVTLFRLSRVIALHTNILVDAVGKEETIMTRTFLVLFVF